MGKIIQIGLLVIGVLIILSALVFLGETYAVLLMLIMVSVLNFNWSRYVREMKYEIEKIFKESLTQPKATEEIPISPNPLPTVPATSVNPNPPIPTITENTVKFITNKPLTEKQRQHIVNEMEKISKMNVSDFPSEETEVHRTARPKKHKKHKPRRIKKSRRRRR